MVREAVGDWLGETPLEADGEEGGRVFRSGGMTGKWCEMLAIT